MGTGDIRTVGDLSVSDAVYARIKEIRDLLNGCSLSLFETKQLEEELRRLEGKINPTWGR